MTFNILATWQNIGAEIMLRTRQRVAVVEVSDGILVTSKQRD